MLFDEKILDLPFQVLGRGYRLFQVKGRMHMKEQAGSIGMLGIN
jgi:hypothetical protein